MMKYTYNNRSKLIQVIKTLIKIIKFLQSYPVININHSSVCNILMFIVIILFTRLKVNNLQKIIFSIHDER